MNNTATNNTATDNTATNNTTANIIEVSCSSETQAKRDAKRIKWLSKKLSWLLRHGAQAEGLAMDGAGWVSVSDVLTRLGMERATLELVVARNNKSRLELDADRVRACQGHSLATMPVTQDALEASWSRYEGNDSLWHATLTKHLDSILESGINRGDRTHVHLASSRGSRVGKRFNAPRLLEVSLTSLRSSGHEVFMSANGVILTRYVPPECIVKIH